MSICMHKLFLNLDYKAFSKLLQIESGHFSFDFNIIMDDDTEEILSS